MKIASLFLSLLAFQDAPELGARLEALLARRVALGPDERASAQAELVAVGAEPREALRQAGPAGILVQGLLGEAAVRPEIQKLLGSDRPAWMRAAAEAMGGLGPDGSSKELQRILEGDDLLAALAAARALSRAKSAPVARTLGALSDKQDLPRRKIFATYALELAAPGERFPILLSLVESETPEVREAAWAAMVNLPGAPAALRRRIDPKEREIAPELRRNFETKPLPPELRALAGLLLLKAGAYQYPDVVERVVHPTAEVAQWARKASVDPVLLRRCVLFQMVLDRLAALEKEPDETKDPIPALEILLQSLGARSSLDKLKDRLAEYRAWWEHHRVGIIDKDVATAIDQGVAWLRAKQQPDGSWKYCLCGAQPNDRHTPGATALAIYTLLKCEVPLKDKAVQAGLDWLLGVPLEKTEGALTYTFSLEAMAFGDAIEILQIQLKAEKSNKAAQAEILQALTRYTKRLRDCVEWLVEAQTQVTRGGYAMGDWGYAKPATHDMDNSNSQFALLGLRAAQNAGVQVPEKAWAKSLNHWAHDQLKDGGWPYRRETADPLQGSTRSMSAAGLYCSLVADASLRRKDPATLVGSPSLKKGFDKMKRDYPVPPPGRERGDGHVHSVYYDLYSLERAMMISKTDRLGDRDWYHDGALYILMNQGLRGEWIDTTDTCFALLFLKKAYIAVATGDPNR
jgi:hypothetical protein